MNDIISNERTPEELQSLKRLTATVYLCQLLTFMLAGLPLLAGVALNFLKHDAVKGTWLESHFDWQIKTAWVVLAGFAISGLTFTMGIGIFVLLITVVWMIYRITIGWHALIDGNPIKASDNASI
ncbi:MAG: hypothetical protein PHW13_03855 [Methylococcales bacterium]|nr:hypothetical protein [Methylococcales bacterium]